MNGKKAKALRRLARVASQGQPEEHYRRYSCPKLDKSLAKIPSQRINEAVNRFGRRELHGCTKAVYREIKKDATRNS